MLIAIFFSPIISLVFTPITYGQTLDATLDLELSEVYVLRGGSFNISVFSQEFTHARITIYLPNGNQYQSYVQKANTEQNIPVLLNAPYGTYKITAVNSTQIITAYIDVLDASGWHAVSFPYNRIWKNLNYTFFSNGTLNIRHLLLSDDSLNIDLSTLRTLAVYYNMDVNAYENSMCFRVRFSKNDIDIDLTFAFLYTGCKFVVNGTLDHARDFLFSITNQDKLRINIDKLRAGNIIFDYKDLRKLNHAFSYYNGVLYLSLPKSFSFDPTIFSDDFESGDFSEWTAVVGSPSVQNTQKHSGTYAMYSNATGEYPSYTLPSSQITVYARAWIYIDTQTGGSTNQIMNLRAGTTLIALIIRTSAGALQLAYRSGTSTSYDTSATTLSLDTWYMIQLKATIGAGTGSVEVWLNGLELTDVEHTSLTNNSGGNITSLRIGCLYTDASAIATYVDTVTINTEYIIDTSAFVCTANVLVPEDFVSNKNINWAYTQALTVDSALDFSKTIMNNLIEALTVDSDMTMEKSFLIIFVECVDNIFFSGVLKNPFPEGLIGEADAIALVVIAALVAATVTGCLLFIIRGKEKTKL